MPMLVFGTFNISESEMKTTIETAITSGYRHFDCASIYRNEEAIGDSLTEIINSGLIDREELYLTSKAWMTHYRDIRSACINSLRRLKTPYLDQYLLHWPIV